MKYQREWQHFQENKEMIISDMISNINQQWIDDSRLIVKEIVEQLLDIILKIKMPCELFCYMLLSEILQGKFRLLLLNKEGNEILNTCWIQLKWPLQQWQIAAKELSVSRKKYLGVISSSDVDSVMLQELFSLHDKIQLLLQLSCMSIDSVLKEMDMEEKALGVVKYGYYNCECEEIYRSIE